MCIIVYKPKGIAIAPDTLKNCYTNNSDGAGFMYPCESRLLIKKGFFTYTDFAAAWEKTRKIHGDKLPVVFHFRISTSGKVDKTNCHPHRIAPDLAFVHNGILSCVKPSRKSRISDTIMYRDRFLADLSGASLRNARLFKAIGQHIGVGNKFAFMNGHGNVAICNENQGMWEKSIWYSNTSFRERFRFPLSPADERCDYCGGPLANADELSYGICHACLMNEFELYCECDGCGEPLITDAQREAGYCDECASHIPGHGWGKSFREYSKSAKDRDVPF